MSMIDLLKKIAFTKEGYQKVQDDIRVLTEKRVGAVVNLRTAREMGDLSENGAYKAARFELSAIDRELRRLNYLLRFGVVVESAHSGVIDFGSTITVKTGDKTMTFLLVDGYESNPKEHKLSVKSPIGRALVGKKVGDQVIVVAPAGKTTYVILEVK